MRYSTQNLTDGKFHTFWHGRGWLRSQGQGEAFFNWEWMFGKFARDFALSIRWGDDDGGRGTCFHVCIPWVFSVYLVFTRWGFKCAESETGVYCHNGAIWLAIFVPEMDHRSEYPWWKHIHSWYFPWSLDWYSTEILSHKANLPGVIETVCSEFSRRRRKGEKRDIFGEMAVREHAEKFVTQTYDYTYKLKNGNVQHRKAAVHVKRMTWRARWWPVIWRKKIRTSIEVKFNEEVGEGTGSYKGGCVGCGYEMRLGETPLETLRRMERERVFKR